MLKIEWIEDILAVLDTGSFAKAADHRCLTQSAFTRRVRTIEETLGCELFDRTRKPVELHSHVKSLEDEMRAAVRQILNLKHQLADNSSHVSEHITFACQHAIATTVSPVLVQEIGSTDGRSAKVRTGSRDDCLLMLLRGDVDFAVIYETSIDAADDAGDVFFRTDLGSELFVPVGNLSEEFRLEEMLQSGELPIVSYPPELHLGSLLNRLILPAIDPKYTMSIRAETGLSLAAFEFVRQGIGVGWLPYSLIKRAVRNQEVSILSQDLPVLRVTLKAISKNKFIKDIDTATWRGLFERHGSEAEPLKQLPEPRLIIDE